jgi:hypothetical protein
VFLITEQTPDASANFLNITTRGENVSYWVIGGSLSLGNNLLWQVFSEGGFADYSEIFTCSGAPDTCDRIGVAIGSGVGGRWSMTTVIEPGSICLLASGLGLLYCRNRQMDYKGFGQ